MKKIIFIIVILIAIIGLFSGGYWYFGSNSNIDFDGDSSSHLVEQEEPLAELLISDVLVPVNDGKRQKLLLLDLSVFATPDHLIELEKSRSRLKNALLIEFGSKSVEYYYQKNLVQNVQDDAMQAFKAMGLNDVKKLYVTKAVYQ